MMNSPGNQRFCSWITVRFTQDGVLATLREHDVEGITFSPYATQIFQALDLSLFGVLIKKMQDKLPFDNDYLTFWFIHKVFIR
jgi:hypothetical protein